MSIFSKIKSAIFGEKGPLGSGHFGTPKPEAAPAPAPQTTAAQPAPTPAPASSGGLNWGSSGASAAPAQNSSAQLNWGQSAATSAPIAAPVASKPAGVPGWGMS